MHSFKSNIILICIFQLSASLTRTKQLTAGTYSPFDRISHQIEIQKAAYTNSFLLKLRQYYVDYFKCAKAYSESDDLQKLCRPFKTGYQLLCPATWVEKWDEQRGVFLLSPFELVGFFLLIAPANRCAIL